MVDNGQMLTQTSGIIDTGKKSVHLSSYNDELVEMLYNCGEGEHDAMMVER